MHVSHSQRVRACFFKTREFFRNWSNPGIQKMTWKWIGMTRIGFSKILLLAQHPIDFPRQERIWSCHVHDFRQIDPPQENAAAFSSAYLRLHATSIALPIRPISAPAVYRFDDASVSSCLTTIPIDAGVKIP
jgi:hypothetical protein